MLLYLKKFNLTLSGLFLIYVNLLHPKPFFCYFFLEFYYSTKLISISRFFFNFKIFLYIKNHESKYLDYAPLNFHLFLRLLWLLYGLIETSCYFFIVDFSFKMLYNTFLTSYVYMRSWEYCSLDSKNS